MPGVLESEEPAESELSEPERMFVITAYHSMNGKDIPVNWKHVAEAMKTTEWSARQVLYRLKDAGCAAWTEDPATLTFTDKGHFTADGLLQDFLVRNPDTVLPELPSLTTKDTKNEESVRRAAKSKQIHKAHLADSLSLSESLVAVQKEVAKEPKKPHWFRRSAEFLWKEMIVKIIVGVAIAAGVGLSLWWLNKHGIEIKK
jgi:hypothetical protein